MSEPISVTKIDLGEGLWEVRNADTGAVIGYDQHSFEPVESDND